MSINHQTEIIAVFGSHSPQPGSADYETGREVGKRLAEAGFSVSTGGYGGLMAAVSQGAAEAGGHVIGVTSGQIAKSRSVKLNRWVEEEIRFESLVDRVSHLVKHNQGMIVLPGGIGTLSELALAWSLMQVEEIKPRPLILLSHIWADMIKAFALPEYILEEHISLIHHVWTPVEAVDVLLELVINERKSQ